MFSIIGGALPFNLCGQNHGQHGECCWKIKVLLNNLKWNSILDDYFCLVFYDIPSKSRDNGEDLEINVRMDPNAVSSRLWEIKITQIPFSAKSPSGCMQYFEGVEGL